MADSPERRLREMATAIADTLQLLRLVLAGLPIPIQIDFFHDGATIEEVEQGMQRIITLIDAMPGVPNGTQAHAEQGTLALLSALDILYVAHVAEGIGYREDAVYFLCTTATLNFHLAHRFLQKE